MVTGILLPLGRRDGLADAYAPSTASPDSKVLGEPRDLLTESLKVPVPRSISPYAPLSSKPLGAFELTYDGEPVLHAGFTEQWAVQQETVRLDRIARTRAAPNVVLARGRMTGWDWIRYGRRIRPRLPAGYLGPAAEVRPFAERGVHGQQLEIPWWHQRRAAAQAHKVSAAGLAAPVSTASVPALAEPARSADPAQAEENTSGLVYLAAAVLVVWLVLRAK